MKFIVKGKYESIDQLPKADLPENAVRFDEPENPAELNIMASLFLLPPIFLMVGIVLFSAALHGGIVMDFTLGSVLLALLLSIAALLPHELLHAVNFPKDAEVQMFYSLKHAMMFVVSTAPLSKGRFIWLSFCPSFVLGWVPFLLWAILPSIPGFSTVLLVFGSLNILFGAGDYMNMWNAWRQMPKGSLTQLSGFHSYWYMPSVPSAQE